MNICVYGAASPEINEAYVEKVENICTELAKRGHNLVFGAGGSGMMGAAARGFKKGGGKVIGVVPEFFKYQKVEALYDQCDETIYTETMADRKSVMEEKADAFMIAPGGVGTLDELFQILALKQLGQMSKQILLLNIDGFYDRIQQWMERSQQQKFLHIGCLDQYMLSDGNDIDEIAAYLEEDPLNKFRKLDMGRYS